MRKIRGWQFQKRILGFLSLLILGSLGGCYRGWSILAFRTSHGTGKKDLQYWYCCVHNNDNPKEKRVVFWLDPSVSLKVDFDTGKCVLGKMTLDFPKGKNVVMVGLDGEPDYLTLEEKDFCRKWGIFEVLPGEERLPGNDIKHPGPVVFREDDKLLVNFEKAMNDKVFKKAWEKFLDSAKRVRGEKDENK